MPRDRNKWHLGSVILLVMAPQTYILVFEDARTACVSYMRRRERFVFTTYKISQYT
jgi:hypothetical protein